MQKEMTRIFLNFALHEWSTKKLTFCFPVKEKIELLPILKCSVLNPYFLFKDDIPSFPFQYATHYIV